MGLTIMENQYINYYKNHSKEQLLEVMNNPSSYNDEARLATYELLHNKKYVFSDSQTIEFENLKKELEQKQLAQKTTESPEPQKDIQSLYSPTAILGFTVFLEPLFGAFLLSRNLKTVKKSKQASWVIVVGLLFLLARMILVYMKQMTQVSSLIISIGAGLIFVEVFWKKHIGYKTPYKRKTTWKPLLISIIVLMCLFGLQMYLNPELFQQLLKEQQIQFNK